MKCGCPYYVGYLPLPRGLRAFVRAVVPILLIVGAVAGALGAIAQRDPGAAVWDGSQMTVEGSLFVDPYPHIVTDNGAVTLLVEMGKFGAQKRSAPHDGARVRATGWLLRRDGRRILELDTGDAIAPQGAAARASPLQQPTGRHDVIEGEIVDAKCYLGAMKPGDGRAHKSCAVLCVRGGIPPTLVAHLPDGSRRYLLVLDRDGGPMPEELVAMVGERVELEGPVVRAEGFGAIRVMRWRPAPAHQ